MTAPGSPDGDPDLGAVVRACSPWDAARFDPSTHVRAVDVLVAVPADRLLAGLRDVAGSFDGDDDPVGSAFRLTLLLRTLFDPPAGGALPHPLTGGAGDPAQPRWPMALVDDVPLLVVAHPPPIRGLVQSVADDLEAVASVGRLRRTTLAVPDDPEAVLASLPTDQREIARSQVARLLGRS